MTAEKKQASEWKALASSRRLSSDDKNQLRGLLFPALQPLMDIVRAGELVSARQFSQVVDEIPESDQHAFQLLARHYITTHEDNIGKARKVLNMRYLEDVTLDFLLSDTSGQMGASLTVGQLGKELEKCYAWHEKYQPILRPTDEGKAQVAALRAAIDKAVEAGLVQTQPAKTASRG